MMVTRFCNLKIANSLVQHLVADQSIVSGPRQVLNAHFSYVIPEKSSNPTLVTIVPLLAAELGIDVTNQTFEERQEMLNILAGNELIPSCKSWALCYGGHQFGSWAGQLGDGRAISLAQISGLNGKQYEIQLKGAGPTPYSRFADGYAVLRSSIREFLGSEAMYHLNVPTSRALSLVHIPSRKVQREEMETGAVVCRVAQSWIRFGNFELLYSRNDFENLKKLADYTLVHVYGFEKNDYIKLADEVVMRTAGLIFLFNFRYDC